MKYPALIFLVVSLGSGWSGASELVDFNRDVRPILAESCFYCHGQDGNHREAGLRLDDEVSAHQSGAVVPGNIDDSLLVDRIHSDDPEALMPPPESNRRLSPMQKQTLARWIAQGGRYDSHWAYVRPQRSTVPSVMSDRKTEGDAHWAKNPIDQFVLAKLRDHAIGPSERAPDATLLKRICIDLTGLPPSLELQAAYASDADPLKYERLVDRLLASESYGERMAMPWLDAARYADSNGFQQDGDTWQWIWRDWVVRAMNGGMSFDQFTTLQLAGDLLPDATDDQKVATAFNRNHLLNGEGGAIAEEQRFNNLFDRVDTTSTTWLALTVACAQCHDHKYDPITQKDYYSLLDAFNQIPDTGQPAYFSPRFRVGVPFIELPTDANKQQLAKLQTRINETNRLAEPIIEAAFLGYRTAVEADPGAPNLAVGLAERLKKPVADRSDEDQAAIENELRQAFERDVKPKLVDRYPIVADARASRQTMDEYRGDQIPRVMVMTTGGDRKSNVLDRGDYTQPREEVKFDVPEFLPPLPDDAPQNRMGLARWLVEPDHPLTARVQVNRMWQHFFGTGIVKTSEDFGVQAEYPIHKDLLDWLAVEFVESGWDVKHLQRLIVTSATYQQSSRVSDWHRENDSDNRLYARASRLRMPSMTLRDWALACSGLLSNQVGGQPVYPYQPPGVWESLAITNERDFTYPTSTDADLYRRSLYTFWRRTMSPANMFDTANRTTCWVRSGTTSTPLHSLTTMNDPTWVEAARVIAANAIRSYPADAIDQPIRDAFQRIVCRDPKASELAHLTNAFDEQWQIFKDTPSDAAAIIDVGASPADTTIEPARLAAMSAICLAILNLDEALTRE